jgi:hypothetical protein
MYAVWRVFLHQFLYIYTCIHFYILETSLNTENYICKQIFRYFTRWILHPCYFSVLGGVKQKLTYALFGTAALQRIVTCRWIRVTKWRVLVQMIGFISTCLHILSITFKLHRQYNALADLHTFKFTVTHTLGFSVSTSRLLATDLHTN